MKKVVNSDRTIGLSPTSVIKRKLRSISEELVDINDKLVDLSDEEYDSLCDNLGSEDLYQAILKFKNIIAKL